MIWFCRGGGGIGVGVGGGQKVVYGKSSRESTKEEEATVRKKERQNAVLYSQDSLALDQVVVIVKPRRHLIIFIRCSNKTTM